MNSISNNRTSIRKFDQRISYLQLILQSLLLDSNLYTIVWKETGSDANTQFCILQVALAPPDLAYIV